MNDTPSKLFGFLCVLASIWIAVYWLWEPSSPRTTLDPRSGDSIPRIPQPTPNGTTPVTPPTPKPVVKPQPKPRVIEPEFTEYVIQRGDTFESIARRHYGDANLKGAIARANPYNSTDLLKPGRTIRIPKDPGNVQGLPAPIEPEVVQPPVQPEPTMPSPPPASPGRKYTIQPEDTIWGISKKFYGKGALHKVIAEANRDKIPNPNDLPVGIEIIIPDQPD